MNWPYQLYYFCYFEFEKICNLIEKFLISATNFFLYFQALEPGINAFFLDHCYLIFTNGNDRNVHTMLEEEKDSHFGKLLNVIDRRFVIVDNASRSEYFRRALRKRALGMIAEHVSRLFVPIYLNTKMIKVSL